MNAKYEQLQHCACLALRNCSRQITQFYEEGLRSVELTSPQFSVLAILKNRGPLAISELAAQLGQERTGLTRNLSLMEKRGWISFQEGSDRRFREVVLSREGSEKLDAAIPLWKSAQKAVEKKLGDVQFLQALAAELGSLTDR